MKIKSLAEIIHKKYCPQAGPEALHDIESMINSVLYAEVDRQRHIEMSKMQLEQPIMPKAPITLNMGGKSVIIERVTAKR